MDSHRPTYLRRVLVNVSLPILAISLLFLFCADFTDTEKDTGVVLQSSLEESGAPSNFDIVAH